MTNNGYGFVYSDDLGKSIYINKTNLNKAFDLDIVNVKVIKTYNGKYEGKVVEIVDRYKNEFIGNLIKHNDSFYCKIDNKKYYVDIKIPNDKLNSCIGGEKVIVKLLSWGKKGPIGEVLRVLGNSGDHKVEVHSIMTEFNLPYEFTQDVINEAELISEIITEKDLIGRLDYRDVLTMTIDGYDARDLDDALSIQWVDGNLEVGVHIADVSHYVKPGSKIYDEALKRGTSVYLCDRVIPMLPEKLSNNLCSLNPNTDKLVFSFIFKLNNNGEVISSLFKKGIINSNYRLTYDEVQNVIDGKLKLDDELNKSLILLNEYAIKIDNLKNKNVSLKIDTPEIKFILDDENKPIDIMVKKQNQANKLIESFMVLTNTNVCEFISKKDKILIHRTHEQPNYDKLLDVKNLTDSLGYNFNIDTNNITIEINNLLNSVKNTNEEGIINSLITKSMSKAKYETINNHHFGLNLEYYTHVTSPIRRFCDLTIHHILTKIIN